MKAANLGVVIRYSLLAFRAGIPDSGFGIRGWRLPAIAASIAFIQGCGSAPKEAAPAEPVVTVEAVPVVRRDMRQLLEVQGSLVPSQGGTAKLTPQVAGRLSAVLVREGETVAKGQLLAKVDVRVQNAQQLGAMAAAQAAQAQSAQSQLAYEASAADQAATVRNAELALDAARLDRETQINQAQNALLTANSDASKTKSQSDQSVIQARVARDHARTDYARSQRLASEGFTSQRDLDAAKATLDTAGGALQVAESSRTADVRAAELRAAGARELLASTRSLGSKRVAQAQSALAQARSAVANVAAKRQEVTASQGLARQKQADLSAASATASLGEIRAPFAGTIARRALNIGDFADTTSAVVEMVGSGSQPDFVGSLSAEDASKVHVGMMVQVGPAVGRVVSISPADPQSGLSSVRVAGVFQGVVGSFSTGQIVLRHDPSAVAVPKEALVDREGKSDVFRIDGDTARIVEVTIVAEDSGFVEVSGVKPGEKLVKVGQFELSDGAKVKVAAPAEKAEEAKGKGD